MCYAHVTLCLGTCVKFVLKGNCPSTSARYCLTDETHFTFSHTQIQAQNSSVLHAELECPSSKYKVNK